MSVERRASEVIESSREDEVLVRECLNGNRLAWSALMDKYKNLIYSIPVKHGFPADDCTEIYQAICLTLLSELSTVREPRALAAWLIRATVHKCIRYRRDQQRLGENSTDEGVQTESGEKLPDELLHELEREQMLREVMNEQAPDCQKLIQLLFFEDPPVPYAEAARILGMATGSIGATRIRCLEKLRRSLEKRDFR